MKYVPVLFLALFASACAASSTNPNVGPGIGRRHANAILGQAEFELNCPREQIRLTKVAQYRIGAEGCGRRGLYVATPAGWILASDGQY